MLILNGKIEPEVRNEGVTKQLASPSMQVNSFTPSLVPQGPSLLSPWLAGSSQAAASSSRNHRHF